MIKIRIFFIFSLLVVFGGSAFCAGGEDGPKKRSSDELESEQRIDDREKRQRTAETTTQDFQNKILQQIYSLAGQFDANFNSLTQKIGSLKTTLDTRLSDLDVRLNNIETKTEQLLQKDASQENENSPQENAERSPMSMQQLVDLGEQLLKENRIAEAKECFERAENQDDDEMAKERAWIQLVLIPNHDQDQDNDKAKEYLSKASEQDDNSLVQREAKFRLSADELTAEFQPDEQTNSTFATNDFLSFSAVDVEVEPVQEHNERTPVQTQSIEIQPEQQPIQTEQVPERVQQELQQQELVQLSSPAPQLSPLSIPLATSVYKALQELKVSLSWSDFVSKFNDLMQHEGESIKQKGSNEEKTDYIIQKFRTRYPDIFPSLVVKKNDLGLADYVIGGITNTQVFFEKNKIICHWNFETQECKDAPILPDNMQCFAIENGKCVYIKKDDDHDDDCDNLPYFEVPQPRLISVTSIKYTDTNGDIQTLATSVYFVDIANEPSRITLKHNQIWPTIRGDANSHRGRAGSYECAADKLARRGSALALLGILWWKPAGSGPMFLQPSPPSRRIRHRGRAE